jgi:hypothetical protein
MPGTDPSSGTHSSCISASGSPVCNSIKQLPTQSVVVLFDFQPGGKEHPWHGFPLLLLPLFAPELLLLLLLLLTPLLLLLLEEEELLFEEDDGMQLGSLMHNDTFFGTNGTTPCPLAPIIATPLNDSRTTPVLVISAGCTV